MSVTDEFRQARDVLLAHRTDIEAAREVFTWPRFPYFNFALDWFDQIAATTKRAHQDALVILEEDGTRYSTTYAELSTHSSQVANWLRSLGVQRGDGLIVMLDNQYELWEVMLAGLKLGAVLLPTTVMLAPEQLIERLERSAARWIITNPDNTQKFDSVPGKFSVITTSTTRLPDATVHPQYRYADSYAAPETFEATESTRADETALIYFTSGTTSRSKMVAHTHTSYPVGHLSTLYWVGLEPGDKHLNVASPGWAKHAWSNFFTPLIGEATVFIYNYARFDAKQLMRVLDEEHVTSICAPPTVWRMMIQADLTEMTNPPTKVLAAGEPLNPVVIDAVKKAWQTDIRDGFGQTETTLLIANTPGQDLKPGSLGRVLPGYEVVLRDPATHEEIEGPGEGEVCLVTEPCPVGLMAEYYQDPDKTQAAFHDGVYHTGDIMERDADGIYTYVGRADDVFKASDYRLSPFELESVLIEHPAVSEAAVVPSPDPIRLSVPKAYVVLADGYAPDALTAQNILTFTARKLPPYAKIRRLEFAELPKTISGKIRRVELRKKEAGFHGALGERTAKALAERTTTGGYGHEYCTEDFD